MGIDENNQKSTSSLSNRSNTNGILSPSSSDSHLHHRGGYYQRQQQIDETPVNFIRTNGSMQNYLLVCLAFCLINLIKIF